MDPVKILKRSWYILWNYRTLWIFGLVLALAAGSSMGRGNNSKFQYEQNHPQNQQFTPHSMQEAFTELGQEMQKLFREGVPSEHISGETVRAFLWVLGTFILVMVILGIVVAIARYVSETAVIRMVDEYEGTTNKLSLRQGLRLGWSNTSWRLFLINLIVNLPVIALMLVFLLAGIGIYFAAVKGNTTFSPISIVFMIGLAFLAIFAVAIVSILLHLLRNFFWRICVLEDARVGESLRRGLAMARANWQNVGLMWIVMIGLGIAWAIGSIILAIVTLPIVLVTAFLAALVVALPFLLLLGVFSTFLSGPLPWIAAGIFVLPFFAILGFSPWLMLGSWQRIYTSTVWTLTYREIKALPATVAPAEVVPVGD